MKSLLQKLVSLSGSEIVFYHCVPSVQSFCADFQQAGEYKDTSRAVEKREEKNNIALKLMILVNIPMHLMSVLGFSQLGLFFRWFEQRDVLVGKERTSVDSLEQCWH